MRLFSCTHCGQLLYFENSHCEHCRLQLGFIAEELKLVPLIEVGTETFAVYGRDEPTFYRYCDNHQYNVCNWMVPVESPLRYCIACSLNRTIPNLGKQEYRQRW